MQLVVQLIWISMRFNFAQNKRKVVSKRYKPQVSSYKPPVTRSKK
jgi:hypothetical protein